jgi:transcriptional regulator with XRE-family HTH domain
MRIDLRHHRLNVAGLSIEAFARELGVTPDVVRNLEKTGRRPHPQNAVKVAKYFELTPDEMWGAELVEPASSTSSTGKAAA